MFYGHLDWRLSYTLTEEVALTLLQHALRMTFLFFPPRKNFTFHLKALILKYLNWSLKCFWYIHLRDFHEMFSLLHKNCCTKLLFCEKLQLLLQVSISICLAMNKKKKYTCLYFHNCNKYNEHIQRPVELVLYLKYTFTYISIPFWVTCCLCTNAFSIVLTVFEATKQRLFCLNVNISAY